MFSSPVILLQADSPQSSALRRKLEDIFGAVQPVSSVAQARRAVAMNRASYAVIDSEIASFDDISALTHDFPATGFVCIHRLADEQMWAEALNAGALDIFSPNDATGIVNAV